MAEQFAVYSDSGEFNILSKPVLMAASSWGVPVNIQSIAAAGSYTIPDALDADANAANKLFTFAVQLSGGAGATRTLKLPENPMDNQVLVIKCVDAGQSALSVEPFDGSDSIDGATSFVLRTDNQTLMLQAVDQGGGSWLWVVLACFGPAATVEVGWSSPVSVTADGTYGLPSEFDSSSTPTVGGGAYSYFTALGYRAIRFDVNISTVSMPGGSTVTVRLRKNGSNQMATAALDNTDSGVHTTSTGAFDVANLPNSIDCVAVVAGSGGTGTFNVTAKAILQLTGN